MAELFRWVTISYPVSIHVCVRYYVGNLRLPGLSPGLPTSRGQRFVSAVASGGIYSLCFTSQRQLLSLGVPASHWWIPSRQHGASWKPWAIENSVMFHDFPMKTSVDRGFSIAMFVFFRGYNQLYIACIYIYTYKCTHTHIYIYIHYGYYNPRKDGKVNLH